MYRNRKVLPMNEKSDSSPWTAALIEQNRRWLIPYLHSLTGNPETARDLAQNVFVIAWQSRQKFDGSRPLGAWLRGIARNVAREHWRKTQRSPVIADSEVMERLDECAGAWEGRCADPDYETDRLEALRGCLDALGEKLSKMFRLKYGDDWNARTIGERVNMKTGAVNMALSRSRNILLGCIQSKMTELGHE